MAQKGGKDKSQNMNANKSGSGNIGQPSKGGRGVPDSTKENGGGNELDSNGNRRGAGSRVSGPEQDRGSLGGGKR